MRRRQVDFGCRMVGGDDARISGIVSHSLSELQLRPRDMSTHAAPFELSVT